MATWLYKVGLLGARRELAVVAVWLVAITGLAGLAVSAGGDLNEATTIPGSTAQTALADMERLFGDPGGDSAQVVYEAPAGERLTGEEAQAAIDAGVSDAAAVPGVAEVQAQESGQVSKDGTTAVAEVAFEQEDASEATVEEVRAAIEAHTPAGANVTFGGDAYVEAHAVVSPTEMVGMAGAMAILAITLGSFLAAGLPLMTALLGLAATGGGLFAAAAVADIPSVGLSLAIMLGLAVGIDYALFVVSRHRQQLAAGMDVQRSIATATATAGSAVVFAAATVIVALLGLAVARVPILTSMGFSAAGAVVLAAAVTLGLLPALLALAGRRLIPRPGSRAARRVTAPASADAPGGAVRWTRAVARRPVRAIVAGMAVMVVLAVPATDLQMALPDNGSEAEQTGTREAYDEIERSFGPGANGPLPVLVTADSAEGAAQNAESLRKELRAIDGVATVASVETADGAPAARIVVVPKTGPTDPETADLVTAVQEKADRTVAGSTTAVVTGQTAVDLDVSERLADAVAPFAIVVVGLSLLLLMVAFRSVWVPVMATLGYLLSVGASLGATIAVFQWGWLADLFGVSEVGPIASFTPTILMAVLFGLAMDYQVFSVSAVRESYGRHGDAQKAIVDGARGAGRVIVAAASIMIVVFASFLLAGDADTMPIAFGLAVGVLVDAFIVRMTMMPAIMRLLGDHAWWLPRWLERRMPDVDLDGERLPEHATA